MSVFQRMFGWAKVWNASSASSSLSLQSEVAAKREKIARELKEMEEKEESKTWECPLCLASVRRKKKVWMAVGPKNQRSCNHWCCEDCLFRFLSDRHGRLDRHPVRCFEPECDTVLLQRVVARVLDESQLKRWERLHVRCALQEAGHTVLPCPHARCDCLMLPPDSLCQGAGASGWFKQENTCGDCGSSFELRSWLVWLPGRWWQTYECDLCGMMFCYKCVAPSALDVPILGFSKPHKMCWRCHEGALHAECPKCTHEFCLRCLREAHPKALCADLKLRVGTWLRGPQSGPNEQQRSRDLMVDRGFRACPGCGMVVEKNQGCNHITHRGCLKPQHDGMITHFCYVCGDAYGRDMSHNCRGVQRLTRSIGRSKPTRSLRVVCNEAPRVVRDKFIALSAKTQWTMVAVLVFLWALVMYWPYRQVF